MNETLPVVIVGAGLGGLTLARLLDAHGLRPVVLEADPDRQSRRQGGMLDIHDDGGQEALRAAGLHEQFSKLILVGAEARRVLDKEAGVRFESQGPGGRPEVERGELRELLLDSLSDDVVRWGAKVVAARTAPAGGAEVALADGSTIQADLLVGADGTWSRVRPLVTDVVPSYTGVVSVDGYVYDADRQHPDAAWAVGAGSLFAVGHERSLMAHREADARLHFYAWMCVPAEWGRAIDFTATEEAKGAVLAEYTGWSPVLRSVVHGATGEMFLRPLYELPSGHTWPRVPGVTLLGDAAHVMTPTGDGANLAMLDAFNLASALLDHPGDTEAALAAYEHKMFARAEAVSAECAGVVELLMRDPDAPRRFVDLLTEIEAEEPAAVGAGVSDT